ncbi:MAG: MerR family DNA-binding transcriptional regulator [Pseudomonadota bacterium]
MLADSGSGSTKQTFTIGDLAKEFNVTLRALRFYESRGLLRPTRDGPLRLYSRRDRARLKLVLMGKAIGFSLNEIKEMLDYYDIGDGQLTQLRVGKTKCESQLMKLKRQKLELDEAVTELGRALNIINNLLAQREADAPGLPNV